MIIEAVTAEGTRELPDIYSPYVRNTAVSLEYEIKNKEKLRIMILIALIIFIQQPTINENEGQNEKINMRHRL